MPKIIAIIGLPGAGKSTASDILEELGFTKLKLGDITTEQLNKRGLEINEKNEKIIRDDLRKEYGMAAYAKLITPKIKDLNKEKIVLDDIISYEEVEFLKNEFKENIKFIAVEADEIIRIQRLTNRKIRPLSEEEAKSRDHHQLEELNMKKSLETADHKITNNSSTENLKNKLKELLKF